MKSPQTTGQRKLLAPAKHSYFTFGLFMHMLNFTMRRDQRMQRSINFIETYDKKTLAAWNTMRPSVKKKLPLNLPMHQEGQYLTYIEKKRNHCF